MRRLSPQVNGQIAWKTGTSYGFRDSWTIGFNRDYVVSVWVGDPSGAAVPGLSGLKSAAPLFFRVMRLLKVKTSFPDAPSSVTRQIICWPLGRLASNTEPSHCHIQRQAWIINDHVPPTRMKTRNRNPLPILVDDVSNKRGDISCLRDKKKVIEIALWPQEVDAWINKRYRISEQLPPLLEGCTDHLSHLNMPQIEGVGDGDLLSLGKDKSRMLTLTNSLNLPVHWYVNGELKSSGSLSFSLALESNRDYQIVIMDSYGNMDKKQFSVFAPLM
jgi:penicillin-binding protein 1C